MQLDLTRRRTLSAITLLMFLAVPALRARGFLGTILGTVTHSSNALVGGATVKVKNQATTLELTTTTQDNGLYQVPNLPVGTYSVNVSKAAFQTENHSQIVVQAERSATVN